VKFEETLFGTKPFDPYRSTEGNDNREFNEWLRAQGAYARRCLDALPGRQPLYERIRDLGLHTGAIADLEIAGGRAFYLMTAPVAQLPVLMVRDAFGQRVLVDPTKMGTADQHASLNSFAPSNDGSLLAYDVSERRGLRDPRARCATPLVGQPR
jgi:prolyl oligopeptidase